MALSEDVLFQQSVQLLEKVIKSSVNLRLDLREDIKSSVEIFTKVYNSLKAQLLTKKENSQWPPPGAGYNAVLSGKQTKVSSSKPLFSVIIKPKKDLESTETKNIVKECINPVKMKIGIDRMVNVNKGGLLIQGSSKSELNDLCKEINNKCKSKLTAELNKKRFPRLIIYNIPVEITKDNAVDTIKEQNSNLFEHNSIIQCKTIILNKLNKDRRHLIVEVDPVLRRKILTNKLKLFWSVCGAEDYIFIRRCYNCCRYHQGDCKGELTCPLCAGDHSMKDCKASSDENYKCINCMQYNNRLKGKTKVQTNHNVMNKNCPFLLSCIERAKNFIDYGDD